MEKEIDRWVMRGVQPEDPGCIHDPDELKAWIRRVGFVPLFRNDIPGFSVEDKTIGSDWWCDDPDRDPWIWRTMIAAEHEIAYGKFFGGRAGFISREWLPYFANYRRDGYDFDALWDDEKAPLRQKKIMDIFDDDTELLSYEIRMKAGFEKGGEKGFEGVITALQMETYLCVSDFRKKINKSGKEYGWSIAAYCRPEHLFGRDHTTGAYAEDPEVSFSRILNRMKELYPDIDEHRLIRAVK